MSNKEQRVIYPEQAPSYYNDWKFSPAIESQGFIFVSGCTGTMDNGVVPDGITAQTRQAFHRIGMCLDEAGVSFADIVEMTTYHVGLKSHLEEFRAAKDEFIVEPYPAWTAIGVSELASEGALVEIRVVAKRRVT
ncbi:MAG: RidA family protein [Leptolyngbyaceae cyanobacterium]